MKPLKDYLKDHPKAQTAIELAIFGAILIFMIGAIVKQALTFSYAQHNNLKGLRMAMSMSLASSQGYIIDYSDGKRRIVKSPDIKEKEKGEKAIWNAGLSARNAASVMIVEDRLTASNAKYGSINRTPYIAQGSASHSRNMFMPTDFGEDKNLPVMDVFVNGKHFPFTVAGFETMNVPVYDRDNPTERPAGLDKYFAWEPYCATITDPELIFPDNQYQAGCAVFPAVVHNTVAMSWKYLFGDDDCFNLDKDGEIIDAPCDDRFDLDRDDVTQCPGCVEGAQVPEEERKDFGWQWYPVYAYDLGKTIAETVYGQPYSAFNPYDDYAIDVDEGINIAADVDGDFKEEYIKEVEQYAYTGLISKIKYLDYQEGDLNFSEGYRGWTKNTPKPGFTNDTNMYTFVREYGDEGGTYLRVEEGKLFDGDQYVRQAQKKDQLDIIERTFRLSKDTKRFCDGTTPKLKVGDPDWGVTNPVEVCVDSSETGAGCASQENRSRTCLDTKSLILYIRSRITDTRGRKWITKTQGDPYMDLSPEKTE